MKEVEFQSLLEDAQCYMADKYSSLQEKDDFKQLLSSYIKQFLIEKELGMEEEKMNDMVTRLYQEIAEYSFLTPYINGMNNDWEAININRWDDTRIRYLDGSIKKSSEQFFSPTHAKNVIATLLRRSGLILDSTIPLVHGFLKDKNRIIVAVPPMVDKEIGIMAAIRRNTRILNQALLVQALTIDPDYICVGEMQGLEAYEALEAARAGDSVIPTFNSSFRAKDYDLHVESEQVCRVCGCTQNNACADGCCWIEDDLCSKCFQQEMKGENKIEKIF